MECDRVVLAPTGVALVTGLGASVTYYADTFEKIGVNPEFEHVGDFKSAVEPYERNGPSEPASLAMNELLDSLFDQVVSATTLLKCPGQALPRTFVGWSSTPAIIAAALAMVSPVSHISLMCGKSVSRK